MVMVRRIMAVQGERTPGTGTKSGYGHQMAGPYQLPVPERNYPYPDATIRIRRLRRGWR